VLRMALRCMRVVSGRFMIAGFVLLSGFTMMARCVFVVLRCLIMVVRCFLRHVESPWNANNWASRPKVRVARWLRARTYAVFSTQA
jgi:hypothetical protein